MVEVRCAPKGSKVLLGANFIEQFIAHTADDSAKKPKDPKGGAADLSSYVNELARQSGSAGGGDPGRDRPVGGGGEGERRPAEARPGGVRGEEVPLGRGELRPCRRRREAPRGRGVPQERRGSRLLRVTPTPTRSILRQALQTYQTALDDLESLPQGPRRPGAPAYPEYASDVRDLALKIANVKADLGIRVAGPDSQRYLEEAIQEYRGQIAQVPKISNPQHWATDPEQPGQPRSRSLGERQGGAEGARRLAEAVEAYRQALAVFTRDHLPQHWATTQNNLGTALEAGRAAGGRRGGAAAGGGGGGLPPGPRRPHPRRPAPGLGHDPEQPGHRAQSLGERQGGAEGARRLAEAVEAYRQALTVRTRDAPPPGLGHDPEQPGQRAPESGRAAGGRRGARRLAEAVRPTARPSPSSPATTSPSTGP